MKPLLAIWLALLGAPLAYELLALANAIPGDTLSEQMVPALMAHDWLWWVGLLAWLAFSAWLTWHWWFQHRNRYRR